MDNGSEKLDIPNFWKWIYLVRHLEYHQKEGLSIYEFAFQCLSKYCYENNLSLKNIILADSSLPDDVFFSQNYQIEYKVEIVNGITDLIYYLDKLPFNLSYFQCCKNNILSSDFLIRILSRFSNFYGYFYEDVRETFNAEDLLEFFIENNELPSNPLPFPNNKESAFRILEFIAKRGFRVPIPELIGETKVIDMTVKIDTPKVDLTSYNEKELVHAAKLQKIYHKNLISPLTDNMGSRPIVDRSSISDIVRLHPYVTPDKFSSSSLFSRIIGLIFVEYLYKHNLPLTSRNIEQSFLYFKKQKLITYDLSKFYKRTKSFLDLEPTILWRWTTQTKKCIETNMVLSIKAGGQQKPAARKSRKAKG